MAKTKAVKEASATRRDTTRDMKRNAAAALHYLQEREERRLRILEEADGALFELRRMAEDHGYEPSDAERDAVARLAEDAGNIHQCLS